jgi:hypothetical protein
MQPRLLPDRSSRGFFMSILKQNIVKPDKFDIWFI